MFCVYMPDLVAAVQNKKQHWSFGCTTVDIYVHHFEVEGILAQCCVSSYSHYCSSPLSYERQDESFWHIAASLIVSVCLCMQTDLQSCAYTVTIYVRLLYTQTASQPVLFFVFKCWMCPKKTCQCPGCSSVLSFPQARGSWMGPFGPTDSYSEGEMECA